jgi:hypothetical protein
MALDLKRKLERLAGVPKDRPEARTATIEKLRELIREVKPKPAVDRAASFDEIPLPGEARETKHGPVHVVSDYLEPGHCHGAEPIRNVLDIDPVLVGRLALAPELGTIDLRRVLVLDTETTGLSTATGTVPFLIGLAFFEDESLKIEQYFLRKLTEEAAMLHAVAERIAEASCLVTYNGATFDWPLLRTRFILNRVPMPPLAAHLDLLHCARRIYKRRLSKVRLVQVEAAVLGRHRENDVAGARIPALYLSYLRQGDAAPMAQVIEHNANDLVALAAVLSKMGRHFARVVAEDDPRDHLSYALVAEKAKDHDRAEAFASAAAVGGGDEALTFEALTCAARTARRKKDVDGETRALERALELATALDPFERASLHLLLAKLYEHRHKDFERALEHCRQTELAEGEEASARRAARLESRIARRG